MLESIRSTVIRRKSNHNLIILNSACTYSISFGKKDWLFHKELRLPETIDELIDTNPNCRLFFTVDLQEYFAALICLSADEFCQPFSWGGNFYVDSGSWVTSSQVQARFFSSMGHCVRKVKYIWWYCILNSFGKFFQFFIICNFPNKVTKQLQFLYYGN